MLKYRGHVIPARFQKEGPNFHKKEKPWRILVAVVKRWRGKAGGKGQGWSSSRLPYPCVPLSPDSRPSARETRNLPVYYTTDTVYTRVHVLCHLIHDLWCKRLGKVSSLTGSNAVFSLSRVRIFGFWLFSHIKFCFKPRRTLNGRCLGSFLWLDDKQQQITKAYLFEFLPRFPPS